MCLGDDCASGAAEQTTILERRVSEARSERVSRREWVTTRPVVQQAWQSSLLRYGHCFLVRSPIKLDCPLILIIGRRLGR